jgi:CRP/FNR family transcriptional regulator, cyclic AMP receptor protein
VDQTFQLLSECVLFRNLERREKEALFSRVRIRDFAASEAIFVIGSPGDSMMIVLGGRVQIGVPSPKGRPHVLAIPSPGGVFGEIALLDGRARSADAIAITACSLAIIDRRDYLVFLEQNPSAWRNIVVLMRGAEATPSPDRKTLLSETGRQLPRGRSGLSRHSRT